AMAGHSIEYSKGLLLTPPRRGTPKSCHCESVALLDGRGNLILQVSYHFLFHEIYRLYLDYYL
ncbi:hypothetical protein KAX35_05800, partial [candidate division WOR-3 bacterium]|nr:hypothetical protein [candidate division WOR-3 bacterium]